MRRQLQGHMERESNYRAREVALVEELHGSRQSLSELQSEGLQLRSLTEVATSSKEVQSKVGTYAHTHVHAVVRS